MVETAEVADDAVVVDDGEVGGRESCESAVVFVGGEEGDTYFGDGTVERRKGGRFVNDVLGRLRGRSDGEGGQGEQDEAN
ncbi:MAG: hypothetical protein ABSD53_18750 [Terriglobales bacterium]